MGERITLSSGSLRRWSVGDVVSGYKIVKILSESSFGYATLHVKRVGTQLTGSSAAVLENLRRSFGDGVEDEFVMKLLPVQNELTFEARQKYERELGILESVRHAGIQELRGAGTCEGHAYHLLHFTHGKALSDILNELNGSPMDVGFAVYVHRRVVDALCVLHNNKIVHRGVAPRSILRASNVYLLEEGSVKLLGLSNAKSVDDLLVSNPNDSEDGARSMDSAELNSVYAPPERYEGESQMVLAGDQFSVGMSLLRCLLGSTFDTYEGLLKEPDKREQLIHPKEFNVSVGSDLDEVVSQLLAEDPFYRFETMFDVKDAFDKLSRAYPAQNDYI